MKALRALRRGIIKSTHKVPEIYPSGEMILPLSRASLVVVLDGDGYRLTLEGDLLKFEDRAPTVDAALKIIHRWMQGVAR